MRGERRGWGVQLKRRQCFPDLCGLRGRKTDAVCRGLASNVLTASVRFAFAAVERTSPHVQFGGTLLDIFPFRQLEAGARRVKCEKCAVTDQRGQNPPESLKT